MQPEVHRTHHYIDPWQTSDQHHASYESESVFMSADLSVS